MPSSSSSIAVPTSSDSINTLAGEIIRPIGARTALNRQKAVAQQLPEEKVATNGEKVATNQGQSGTRRQALNARMSSTTGMRNWGFGFWKSWELFLWNGVVAKSLLSDFYYFVLFPKMFPSFVVWPILCDGQQMAGVTQEDGWTYQQPCWEPRRWGTPFQ